MPDESKELEQKGDLSDKTNMVLSLIDGVLCYEKNDLYNSLYINKAKNDVLELAKKVITEYGITNAGLVQQLTATQQALDTAVERIKELESAVTVDFNDRMKINQSFISEIECLNEEIARYKRSSKDRRELIKSNDLKITFTVLYEEVANVFNNFDLCDASHVEVGDARYHDELLQRLKAALAAIKE